MNSLRKLTYEQYTELEQQYQLTPSQYEFSVTGEHYMLRSLLRQYGYRVGTSRGAELELASKLLSQGYQR